MNRKLRKLIETGDEDERRGALFGLEVPARGKARKEALETVLFALKDTSWRVRKAALDVMLSCFSPEEPMPGLVALLGLPDNAGARNSAIEGFVRIGSHAVDHLAGAFKTADADVRKFIMDIAGESGDKKFIPLLMSALEDSDPNVVASAVEHLGIMKEPSAVGALEEIIDRGDVWTSYPAVEALGNISDERSIPTLLRLLKDKALREPALRALGKLGGEREVRDIVFHINDRSRSVQHEALASLERIYKRGASEASISDALHECFGEKVVDILIEYARSAKEDIRASSILFLGLVRDSRALAPLVEMARDEQNADELRKALVYIGRNDPEALAPHSRGRSAIETRFLCGVMADVASPVYFDILVEFLGHDDGHVRSYAARGLANIGDERAVPYLMRNLADQYEDVQESIVRSLMTLKDGLDLDELIGLLKSPDPVVRRSAVLVLGSQDSPRVVESITFALKDVDARVRMAVVITLGIIKSEDAFLGLLLATGDEDPAIRALAARKLGDTGLERFIGTVRVMLSDPDVLVRVSACKSMGSIGTLDEVPDLVQLLGDPDGHVVVSAIEALGSIGGHDARDAVMSMVRSSDIEFRRTSLKALGGFQGVEDVLLEFLSDSDWATRVEAARALRDHRQSNVMESVSRALENEQDPIVQTALQEYLNDKP